MICHELNLASSRWPWVLVQWWTCFYASVGDKTGRDPSPNNMMQFRLRNLAQDRHKVTHRLLEMMICLKATMMNDGVQPLTRWNNKSEGWFNSYLTSLIMGNSSLLNNDPTMVPRQYLKRSRGKQKATPCQRPFRKGESNFFQMIDLVSRIAFFP